MKERAANDRGVVYIPEVSGSVVAHHVRCITQSRFSTIGCKSLKRVHETLHRFPNPVSTNGVSSMRLLVKVR